MTGRRVVGVAQRMVRSGGRMGRQGGLLPYRTERWGTDRWQQGYGADQLDFFAGWPERARYSILAGYLGGGPAGAVILDVGCGRGLLRSCIQGIAFGSY